MFWFLLWFYQISLWDWYIDKWFYPYDLVEKCVKEFLEKTKTVVTTAPKKDLVIALPYLDKVCLQIRIRINRIVKNRLPWFNVVFVFQTKCKIRNFFTFKDKIPSFYVLALFTNLSVVVAMLPIMEKLNVSF